MSGKSSVVVEMKSNYRFIILILITLFVFNLTSSLHAGQISREEELQNFINKLAEYIGENDEKGTVNLIVKNQKTAKETFHILFALLEDKISKGINDDDTETAVILSGIIAAVFRDKLGDDTMDKKLHALDNIYASPKQGDNTSQGNPLAGVWSDTGSHMDIVDVNTGSFKSTSSFQFWYVFREDGTFTYVGYAYSQSSKGLCYTNGKYRVQGNKIILSDCTETWKPYPGDITPEYKNKPLDKLNGVTLEFGFKDNGKTLIIPAPSDVPLSGEYYYRVEKK
ncbi:MAG: hypothetical protein ABRQ39_29635 [Candidatus Eremiobacterota bacterium]